MPKGRNTMKNNEMPDENGYILRYDEGLVNLGDDMSLKDVQDIFGDDFCKVIEVKGGYKLKVLGAIRFFGAKPNDPAVNPPEVYSLEQLKDFARQLYVKDRIALQSE